MTDWTRIARCAGPNPRTFPDGESVYLFCHVDPNSSDWPAIRWAPGVSYFLSTGHVLSPVPDELISQIEERVSMWNTGGYEPQFKPGERVSVLSGPFFGLEAIFQRYIPARQRCEVLLQTLNKLAKVEIPLNSLRQIDRYQNLTIAT